MPYFSERELGPRPRTREEITLQAWKGVVGAILSRARDGSFGSVFQDLCPDGGGVVGTDFSMMSRAVAGEFPYLTWPLDPESVPSVYDVLDLVQFCYERVAAPVRSGYHGFFMHYHFEFDRDGGRADFRRLINRIFARNEIAFDLREDGELVRLAPVVLRESLEAATFSTGDATLDELLEVSRRKFLSHDYDTRKEGLEKLWDAWERLKTIEPGKDKKESVTRLLDRTSAEPNFRQRLEDEAGALTDIGNKFIIRHTEVGKIPITSPEHVDYLFHRLFALIRLAVRSTGRGG